MILEQILAELQKLNANLANGNSNVVTQPIAPNAPQTYAPVPPVATATAMSPVAPVPSAINTVTAEDITALVQPHISNPIIKEALGAAMRGMGINALPETPAHMFNQLYAAFQQVLSQHATAQPAPAPVNNSII